MNLLKGALKSKTIWFNALFAAVLVANAFGFQDFQPDETILLVGNVILRFLTVTSLADK